MIIGQICLIIAILGIFLYIEERREERDIERNQQQVDTNELRQTLCVILHDARDRSSSDASIEFYETSGVRLGCRWALEVASRH